MAADVIFVKAEDVRPGMENWHGKVYFGEGGPRTIGDTTQIVYALDDEEYPYLNMVTYKKGELIEFWA